MLVVAVKSERLLVLGQKKKKKLWINDKEKYELIYLLKFE